MMILVAEPLSLFIQCYFFLSNIHSFIHTYIQVNVLLDPPAGGGGDDAAVL